MQQVLLWGSTRLEGTSNAICARMWVDAECLICKMKHGIAVSADVI